MTLVWLLLKLVLIVSIGLIMFTGLLYLTLRTKVIELSHRIPYVELLGTTVAIKRPTEIVVLKQNLRHENLYRIQLEDRPAADILERYTLPVGTKLKLTKAKGFINGISGLTTAAILGTFYFEEKKEEVAFEMNWGTETTTVAGGSYYLLEQAPWQEEPLAFKFYYKTGKKEPYDWSKH
ncbi:MAG: hypothetical protein AB8G15_15800 [Saprospiraceae bacterium]